MQRDRRLLAALFLFMVALVAGIIQAWIVNAYVRSAIRGVWEPFADAFGVTAPAKFCLDYCAPELPFVAGWVAIAAFISGLITLAFTWWTPKANV